MGVEAHAAGLGPRTGCQSRVVMPHIGWRPMYSSLTGLVDLQPPEDSTAGAWLRVQLSNEFTPRSVDDSSGLGISGFRLCG